MQEPVSMSVPKPSQQPSIQDLPSLLPPSPERCAPPVYVNADGEVIPDPWALLGIAPGVNQDAIRDAWANQTRLLNAESDPERARQLREARDRLSLPDRLLERMFGVLSPPSPTAWDLPTPAPVEQNPSPSMLDARTRLLAQSILYTLVEQVLSEPEPPTHTAPSDNTPPS